MTTHRRRFLSLSLAAIVLAACGAAPEQAEPPTPTPLPPDPVLERPTYTVTSGPIERVLEITVRNLSPRGCMGQCAAVLGEGERVGIDLPGYGIAPAIVRWSGDGEVGCQFRRPVDVDRCEEASTRTGLFTRGLAA